MSVWELGFFVCSFVCFALLGDRDYNFLIHSVDRYLISKWLSTGYKIHWGFEDSVTPFVNYLENGQILF